jgi:hypothetical protein
MVCQKECVSECDYSIPHIYIYIYMMIIDIDDDDDWLMMIDTLVLLFCCVNELILINNLLL